ncbi:hypothetical protein JL720_528 [Aureococcus anophagefferens]|nr:hypothetical protein JL720_528 [Aureococcus anophagefferens]
MFVKLAKMYGTYNDQGVSIRKQLAALSMRTLGGPTELQLELDDLSQLYEDTCGHALPEGQETPPNGAPWRHSEVNGQRTLEVYRDGWGVAHYAAWDNDVATLEAVDGATLAARDAHGQAAVHVAAMAGHVAALEMLAPAPRARFEGERGFASPAWLAALGNHAAVVEELAKFVDLKDVAHPQNGWSPLHVAVEKGHLEVLEALASAGQDLNRRTHDSYAPIHRAAYLGRADVAGVLADYGADLTRDARRRVGLRAAQYGHAGVIEVLASYGADVDAAKRDAATPASVAAQNGHGVRRRLGGRAADLDRPRTTPTRRSTSRPTTATPTSSRCSRGAARTSTRGTRRATPPHAAAAGHGAVLRALKAAGADLGRRNAKGLTPAFMAAQYGMADALGHVDTLAIFTEARTKKLENRTSAPDDVGEEDEAGAELQRALDAANSEPGVGVEIDASASRDAAEARAKDAEASRAAAAAVARTREAKAKEREAKLAGDLRDLRKRRDRDARAKDVDQLLGLDVSRLHVSVLTKLTQKIPALLHKVTREHLRREMAAANPAATSPRAHAEPDQASECIVCLEASREVAFGCGHLCVCDGCSTVVGECPICRAPITERRRILSS